MLFPKLYKGLIRRLLLGRLFGMTGSCAHFLISDPQLYLEYLIMIRPALSGQFVMHGAQILSLDSLLQDSLAIIKELLMRNVSMMS